MRAFIIVILLSGICSMVFGCTPSTVMSTPCPELADYSKDFQKEAADQIKGLPDGSPLVVMIMDYKRLRDGCRVH